MQDRLRETDPLVVALRELVYRPVEDFLDARLLDGQVHVGFALSAVQTAKLRDEGEILRHQHVLVQRVVLRQVAYRAARLLVALLVVDALDADRPAVRRVVRRDQPHGGRLAGAVGPEEADDFALVHLEADVVHGDVVAEAFRDAPDVDRRLRLFALPGLPFGLDHPLPAPVHIHSTTKLRNRIHQPPSSERHPRKRRTGYSDYRYGAPARSTSGTACNCAELGCLVLPPRRGRESPPS